MTYLHRAGRDPAEEALGFMVPAWFEAAVFDESGAGPKAQLRWEGRFHDADFLPTREGFLVRAADKLYVYSLDFKQRKERALPETVKKQTYRSTYSAVQTTPEGGSAFIQTFYEKDNESWARNCWIDLDDLSDQSCFEEAFQNPLAASRTVLARLDQYQLPDDTVRIWHPSGTPPERRFIAPTGTPMFLAEGLLLLKSRRVVRVMDLEWKQIFKAPLEYLVFDSVCHSMDGKRFALVDEKGPRSILRGREFYARSAAYVFDVRTKSRVAKISLGAHDLRMISLALSPDGSRLAVLTESKLLVYDLPINRAN